MAEGIGEHAMSLPLVKPPRVPDSAPNHDDRMLNDNSHPLDGASLDEQYTADRLHRVRRSIMPFDAALEEPTSVFDLAVTCAPAVAKSEGVYGSGQFTVFSKELN